MIEIQVPNPAPRYAIVVGVDGKASVAEPCQTMTVVEANPQIARSIFAECRCNWQEIVVVYWESISLRVVVKSLGGALPSADQCLVFESAEIQTSPCASS